MRPHKPSKMDRKHPEAAREPMEDIKDLSGDARTVQNDIRYMEPNRDRALGEADRTGRHFDATPPTEGEQEQKGEKQ
jgi:hypothetical protein